MSTLVVVGYDEPFQADELLLKLRKLQREYLLDLEDAAVAIKDQQGKVKLHQTVNLAAAGAIRGGFWGSLIGLIFLNPLLGFAMGATPLLTPTKQFSYPNIRCGRFVCGTCEGQVSLRIKL